jgi:hypothetical protein
MNHVMVFGSVSALLFTGCGVAAGDGSPQGQNDDALASSTASCATGDTLFNGVCVPSDDFASWIQPYESHIEKVRAVLMTPYTLGQQHYGYDGTFGLVRGANIEPSPAIGVSNGYNDAIVLIDNNLEGSASLDFWNSYAGVKSSVEANCRAFLDATAFDEISGACPPFATIKYDGTDRREAQLGSHSPYHAQLSKAGAQIFNTSGQTDYVPGYEGIGGAAASCSKPPKLQTDEAHPLIVTALPIDHAIGEGGNLENDGPWIDLAFEQGSPKAQAEYAKVVQAWDGNTFGSYGGATRDLLHFIIASRATGFWRDGSIKGPKGTAEEVLKQVITLVWEIAGSNGGLPQSYSGTLGSGGDQTPEPNFQAMLAFDPRLPTWF